MSSVVICFTITQFFQVLKWLVSSVARLPGFTITQFFQVLKLLCVVCLDSLGFTITQFFQVLKWQMEVERQLRVLR